MGNKLEQAWEAETPALYFKHILVDNFEEY